MSDVGGRHDGASGRHGEAGGRQGEAGGRHDATGRPHDEVSGRYGEAAGQARAAVIDAVVHHTLVAGITVGLALLVAGLVLTVAGRGGLAVASLKVPAALRAAFHLRAPGFYSLGLFALILTPFVRVVGSIVAFAVARDWRFVAVTSVVLAVMLVSIAVGAA